MKPFFKTTLLALGIICLLFACGKDDTSPTTPTEENSNNSNSTATSGYLIFDGVRYPLNSAMQVIESDTSGNFEFAPYRVSRLILFSDKPLVRQGGNPDFDSTATVACYTYIFSKDVSSSLLGTFPISPETDTSRTDVSWFFVTFPKTGAANYTAETGSTKFESLGNNTYKLESQTFSQDSTEVRVLLQGALNDQP